MKHIKSLLSRQLPQAKNVHTKEMNDMQPAIKVRIGRLHVATHHGQVELTIGEESVALSSDDIHALTSSLHVADYLAENGY